jgi:hypothetical protein
MKVLTSIKSQIALIAALLILNSCVPNGRSYEFKLDEIGYNGIFKEVEADTILEFTFTKINDNNTRNLRIRNASWDVISFVFYNGNDTIYIRKGSEWIDLFSPTERASFKTKQPLNGNIKPPYNPVKGDLPDGFKLIAYGDVRFFKWGNNESLYILKNDSIHIVTLMHYVERGNEYGMWNTSATDTTSIFLRETTNSSVTHNLN